MERNGRISGRRRWAGVGAVRQLRKLDPVVAGLAALIVVLSIAWGALYLKESSGQSLVAYEEASAEADYEKAYESRGESHVGTRAPDEEYLPPGDPRGSRRPQSAIGGNGSESGESIPIRSGAVESSPSPSGADDELPGEPKSEERLSPEVKYGQEIEKAQASCASLMNGKMEEAEKALKPIDRGNAFEAKAWSDTWTRELSEAEAACDESFDALTERAMGESVSQGKIDEWTLAYESRKKELQADSRAKLQRLLRG